MSEQPKEYIIKESDMMEVCRILSLKGNPQLAQAFESVCRSRPHQAPTQGTSKLCFGTQHPASECCQQCNELETCKQKQRYLDYDKKEAARKAREDVLDEVREKLSHIRFQEEDMWFIEATIKAIESLRTQQQAGRK